MTPIWPFKKKKSSSRLKNSKFTENIVEYERKVMAKDSKKGEGKAHLNNKKFLVAMKLFDDD